MDCGQVLMYVPLLYFSLYVFVFLDGIVAILQSDLEHAIIVIIISILVYFASSRDEDERKKSTDITVAEAPRNLLQLEAGAANSGHRSLYRERADTCTRRGTSCYMCLLCRAQSQGFRADTFGFRHSHPNRPPPRTVRKHDHTDAAQSAQQPSVSRTVARERRLSEYSLYNAI